MTNAKTTAIALNPRWDGRRVLFEVADGGRGVACTISANALQDLSGQRRFKPLDLLACFAAARSQIEAIALVKLRARTASATGLLYIWSDDIDDPPPASAPAAMPPPKALRTA